MSPNYTENFPTVSPTAGPELRGTLGGEVRLWDSGIEKRIFEGASTKGFEAKMLRSLKSCNWPGRQAFGLGGQKRTVGRPLVAGSEGGTVPCEADVGRSNSPEKCTLSSSSSYFSSSCTQLNSGQPGSPPLCRPKASPGRWGRRKTVSCVH